MRSQLFFELFVLWPGPAVLVSRSCRTARLKLRAGSSSCLTTIVGALGQQMGHDTSGTARLCCLTSEAVSWEDVSGGPGGSDSERGRAWRVPGTVPLHVAWAHQAGGKGRLSSARTVHGSGQRGCLRGSNVPQSKRPRRTRWRLPSQAT